MTNFVRVDYGANEWARSPSVRDPPLSFFEVTSVTSLELDSRPLIEKN